MGSSGQLCSDNHFVVVTAGALIARKIKVIPCYSGSFGETRIFHLGGINFSTEGGIEHSNNGKNIPSGIIKTFPLSEHTCTLCSLITNGIS